MQDVIGQDPVGLAVKSTTRDVVSVWCFTEEDDWRRARARRRVLKVAVALATLFTVLLMVAPVPHWI